MLDLNPAQRDIERMRQRFGGEVTQKQAPELPKYLSFALQAFFDLNSERVGNMAGPGHIPWRAIKEYGSFYRLTLTEVEQLVIYINAMDNAYLKKVMEK